MHRLAFKSAMAAQMTRNRNFLDGMKFTGIYRAEHWRRGKLLDIYEWHNDVTNEGKNLMLGVMFYDTAAIASTSWYIGLISSVSYSALAAGDTMLSHAGWTEFTGYTQSNRVAWGPAAPSGQAITGAASATFTFNTTGTVKGGFLTSNNAKSGTTGKLWSTGLYPSDIPVVSSDELKVTYNLSC